jgi:hypothetical protein
VVVAPLATGHWPLATGYWPVLVDFGLSTAFAGARGREPLEALHLGAGTVAYMAPEHHCP